MNETLVKTNIIGRDGFVWWIGRVAAASAWKKQNNTLAVDSKKQQRVKVRIIGYHPWEETEMPENDLPWAEVMQDAQVGSGQGGMGETMSLQGGETAVGFFLDGEDGQQPVIMGLLNRNQETESSKGSDENITPDMSGGFETWTNKTQEQSITARDTNFTKKNPNSIITKNNDVTKAEGAAERLYDTDEVIDSTCGDDAISRIGQFLKDFISVTDNLTKVGEKYIDPMLEEFVDVQKKVKVFAKKILTVIKSILNNIRKGIMGKINIIFGKFLAKLKKFNPFAFLTDPIAKMAKTNILKILWCNFEKIIGGFYNFLLGMLNQLIGRVIGGPICAIEQFISGLLSKLMNMLEGLLKPLLAGLNWLMGGFASVAGVLKKASAFAKAIYSFLSCNGPLCSKPGKWASKANGFLEGKMDDWDKKGGIIGGMDVFSGINDSLTGIGKNINTSINTGFGVEEVDGEVKLVTDINEPVIQNEDGSYTSIDQFNYNGSSAQEVLDNVDTLTGGNLSGTAADKLSSIEAAISTMPLLGGKNSIFNACDPYNITNQDDLVTKPGTKAPNCIPPEVRLNGNGSGADLFLSVANNSTIFAIDVINGGSGYDSDTSVVIVDNSGYGSGAQAQAQIVNGAIDSVVLINPGYGYCSGNTGIGTVGVGTTGGIGVGTTGTGPGTGTTTGIGTGTYGYVEDVFVYKPGTNYDPDDRVKICAVGVCTYMPIKTTPWGEIGEVEWKPIEWEVEETPTITVETDTGYGAVFIPRMRYFEQSTSDIQRTQKRSTTGISDGSITGTVKPLIGITTVIDCPTTDHY